MEAVCQRVVKREYFQGREEKEEGGAVWQERNIGWGGQKQHFSGIDLGERKQHTRGASEGFPFSRSPDKRLDILTVCLANHRGKKEFLCSWEPCDEPPSPRKFPLKPSHKAVVQFPKSKDKR